MEDLRQVLVIYSSESHKNESLFTGLINNGTEIVFLHIDNVEDENQFNLQSPRILVADQNTRAEAIKSCIAKYHFINLLLVESAVLAQRADLYEVAVDIVICPFNPRELLIRLERSMVLLCQKYKGKSRGEEKISKNLVGDSPEFHTIVKKIKRYTNIEAPVLITGETGTGKELVARALHYASERKSMPFQAINCGALPENLIESELFGHAKGAFTDAKECFQGVIAMAEGGTLFLDEVDSLSYKAQTALLRFLQDGKYRAVGSSTAKTSNVRIISATNNNLDELANEKLFRRDLIFRLNTLPLYLPPLRQRGSDILLLAEHFLDKCAYEHGNGKKMFHLMLKEKLVSYVWPGNIRELENYVQRAYLLSDQMIIGMLPDTSVGEMDLADDDGGFQNASDEQFSRHKSESGEVHVATDSSESDSQLNEVPEFSVAKKAVIDDFEVSYIRQLLQHTHGNVSRAAKLAGKERRVFGRLMKKHHIEKSVFMVG